jgi:hypothetical protein
VAAVRRPVDQRAAALARDLALVHHQIAGDGSFADALSPVSCCGHLAGTVRPTGLTANIAKLLDFRDRAGWIRVVLVLDHFDYAIKKWGFIFPLRC